MYYVRVWYVTYYYLDNFSTQGRNRPILQPLSQVTQTLQATRFQLTILRCNQYCELEHCCPKKYIAT